MVKAGKGQDRAFLILMGTVGGLCLGIVAGAAVGITIMLLLMLGDQQAFDAGLVFLVLLMALVVGAFYGAIAGAIFGCLLGIAFCFIQYRSIGALAGCLGGWAACFYVWGGSFHPPVLPFFAVGMAISAVAGYSLACLLLKPARAS